MEDYYDQTLTLRLTRRQVGFLSQLNDDTINDWEEGYHDEELDSALKLQDIFMKSL